VRPNWPRPGCGRQTSSPRRPKVAHSATMTTRTWWRIGPGDGPSDPKTLQVHSSTAPAVRQPRPGHQNERRLHHEGAGTRAPTTSATDW